MSIVFYIAAAVAVLATGMVITRLNAVHGLLYLIVSLMAVAVVFLMLGASFAAALEIIIYAGAIMVLFIFAIMILNLGAHTVEQERRWLQPSMWIGPTVLAGILLVDFLCVLWKSPAMAEGSGTSPREVGARLFGSYGIAVELASFILLAGLVGAYHLGRRDDAARGELPHE
jgi:NADH-quinone oxidoreductase subunit J